MSEANETNQGAHLGTKKPEEKVVWPEPETLEEAKGALKILQCTVENEASLFAALDIKYEAAKNMLQSQEEGFRATFREKDGRIKTHETYISGLEREVASLEDAEEGRAALIDALKNRLVELEQNNKELNEKAEPVDWSMKIEKIRATAVRAENMSRALLSISTVIAGLNQSVKDRLDALAKAARVDCL